MEYLEITNNDLVVNKNGNEININLNKIEKIKSSVEINISKMKTILYTLICIGILLTLFNISSNLFEKLVPEKQYGAIYYERGFNQYKIQPNGFGSSIYDVHIGKDGKFYYSIDLFAFAIGELFICLFIFLPSWILYKNITPSIKAYNNNIHFISFRINNIEHLVYTGEFHKTNDILILLRSKCDKAQYA